MRLLAITGLSIAVLALLPSQGFSQQPAAGGHSHLKPKDQRAPVTLAPVPVEPSSSLGQALAACERTAAAQDTFSLPGLKGDITLDRCYKGRAHMVCVFDALVSEAKSLTDAYTKIVDAKYPDVSSVDNICLIKADTLASDIDGADDFTKRFAALRTQYDSASRCAATVKQAFQNVVLSDMSQPPEILKSMTDSMDADINRVSETENQISDLAERMVAADKAMRTIAKIHRTMCVKDSGQSAALGTAQTGRQ